MSNVIKLKRSAVPGKIPQVSDLELGEIALNTWDGKLYIKRYNGAEEIVMISGAQSSFADIWNADTISGGSYTTLLSPIVSAGSFTDSWDDKVFGGNF